MKVTVTRYEMDERGYAIHPGTPVGWDELNAATSFEGGTGEAYAPEIPPGREFPEGLTWAAEITSGSLDREVASDCHDDEGNAYYEGGARIEDHAAFHFVRTMWPDRKQYLFTVSITP